jgi:hypothetical protein
MAVSALAIGVNRVMAAPQTAARVSSEGLAHIYPICPPDKQVSASIVVNRLFERAEDGNTVIGLALTVFGKTVNEIEEIGATLVEEIDGTADFNFAELIGITFDKSGPDVTGYDASRSLMFRQIEFAVTY